MNITRTLNSRERRRLEVHGMVPVDAIDPACSTRKLIENKTTHLYRYGCYLQDTNVELEDFISIRAAGRSSVASFVHLRGFNHHLHKFTIALYSSISLIYVYNFFLIVKLN